MTKVIRFTASWCTPCKAYAPIFENVASSTPGVEFQTVDIDANRPMAESFLVRSVPTTVVVEGGKTVFQKSGLMGETELRQVVASH